MGDADVNPAAQRAANMKSARGDAGGNRRDAREQALRQASGSLGEAAATMLSSAQPSGSGAQEQAESDFRAALDNWAKIARSERAAWPRAINACERPLKEAFKSPDVAYATAFRALQVAATTREPGLTFTLFADAFFKSSKGCPPAPVAVRDEAEQWATELIAQAGLARSTGDQAEFKRHPRAITLLKVAESLGAHVSPAAIASYANIALELARKWSVRNIPRHKALQHLLRDIVQLAQSEPSILDIVDCAEAVHIGVACGCAADMEDLAELDPTRELARIIIDDSLAKDPRDFYRAQKSVVRFDMSDMYPAVVAEHRSRMLQGCLNKGRLNEAFFRLERYCNHALTSDFIQKLCELNEHRLAQYLAARLAIPQDDPMRKCIDVAREAEQRREWEENKLTLGVDITSGVVFVDSLQSAVDFAQAVAALKSNALAGMDCEWRPVMSKGQSAVSIFQIAFQDKVFILDLLWLQRLRPSFPLPCAETVHILHEAVGTLFQRQDIFKIGFGFSGDLKMIAAAFPELQTWRTVTNMVDLQLLGLDVGSAGAAWTMRPSRKAKGGLKDLVSLVLKKNLCKLEQMSNWEDRPLREEQLRYAATDAYCAIQIFWEVFGKAEPWAFPIVGFASLSQFGPRSTSLGELRPGLGTVQFASRPNSREESSRLPSDANMAHTVKLLQSRCTERQLQFDPDATSLSAVNPACDAAVLAISGSTFSVRATSSNLGIPLSSCLKSMAFMIQDRPVLVVIRGDTYVDEARLAQHFACQEVELRRATPAECVELFEHQPGTIGPVTEHRSAQVILDSAIADCGSPGLLCGSGVPGQLIYTRSITVLRKLVFADVHSVATEPRGHPSEAKQRIHSQPPAASPRASEQGGAARAEPKPRFVVDDMLGRVGKMLRMVGYDCLYFADIPSIDYEGGRAVAPGESRAARRPQSREAEKQRRVALRREQLAVALGTARAEGRIFLTTDRKAVARGAFGAGVCVLDKPGRYEQFAEVCSRFHLPLASEQFLSRCVDCNSEGFNVVSKEYLISEKAAGRIDDKALPDGVLAKMDDFYQCKNAACGKVFWEGPKFERAIEAFQPLYQQPLRSSGAVDDRVSSDIHEQFAASAAT